LYNKDHIGVALGESQASKYAWPNAYNIYALNALMTDRIFFVLDIKVIPKQFLNFPRKKMNRKMKELTVWLRSVRMICP